jgi:uncharacterized transporter YbjL
MANMNLTLISNIRDIGKIISFMEEENYYVISHYFLMVFLKMD